MKHLPEEEYHETVSIALSSPPYGLIYKVAIPPSSAKTAGANEKMKTAASRTDISFFILIFSFSIYFIINYIIYKSLP